MRALLLTLRACIANGYVRHPVASHPRVWSYPKCKAMRVREHGVGVADAMENVSHTGRERGWGRVSPGAGSRLIGAAHDVRPVFCYGPTERVVSERMICK